MAVSSAIFGHGVLPLLRRRDTVQRFDRGIARAAAGHALRLLALSYPRSRRLTRWMVAAINASRWLIRSDFRVFVHPPAAMQAVLEQAGLRRAWAGGTWIWAVEVFEREASVASGAPRASA